MNWLNIFAAQIKTGEVSEWPNVQAWKVCVPQGTAGSNPALSAKIVTPTLTGFLGISSAL